MAKRTEILLCAVALIVGLVIALAIPAGYLVEGFQSTTGIRLPTKEIYGQTVIFVAAVKWIAVIGVGLRLIWLAMAARRGV